MSECPIELVCELMVCRREVCNEYAAPWDIPYSLVDWHVNYGRCKPYLRVSFPGYDTMDYSTDYECHRQIMWNHYVSRYREELYSFGWWPSITLPYEAVEGGMKVNFKLVLNEYTSFSCPWPCEYDLSEGFHPALPIDLENTDYSFKKTPDLDERGFWKDLIWFK